jgi:hypothetical protein
MKTSVLNTLAIALITNVTVTKKAKFTPFLLFNSRASHHQALLLSPILVT